MLQQCCVLLGIQVLLAYFSCYLKTSMISSQLHHVCVIIFTFYGDTISNCILKVGVKLLKHAIAQIVQSMPSITSSQRSSVILVEARVRGLNGNVEDWGTTGMIRWSLVRLPRLEGSLDQTQRLEWQLWCHSKWRYQFLHMQLLFSSLKCNAKL